MHIHRQSRRLPLGLCVCGVMVGVAASTVSSCSKTKTPTATAPVVPDSGTLGGTISSSQGGPLVGVDVTAEDANKNEYTVSTDPSGDYVIPVLAGAGTIAVSQLPSNCTTPAAGQYTVGRSDTTIVLITVACTP